LENDQGTGIISADKSSRIDLEIDGGITLDNVKSVKDAGANVIVAGSTVFGAPDRKKMMEDLRKA
jgi:ribulose-phosphate 3-epimerase